MLNRKFKLVQKVPKTPKSAYNHGRFISGLLENQVRHFHEVEKSLAAPGEPLTDISKIKTEFHASKYLKKMTARLHPEGAVRGEKSSRPKKARSKAKPSRSSKKKQSRDKRKKRK